MNLTALQAELVARGFDYLSTARQTQYINAGRAELDRMFLWPWRETTTSGAAPLVVSDVGPIQSVQTSAVSNTPLAKADYGFLTDSFGDLTISGLPRYYYLDRTSGTATVAVFPVSTASISVRYWRVTPDLVAGTDVPVSPTEAHYTIVDLAIRRAYRDADDPQNAQGLQPEIDNAIGQLLVQYPPGQMDGPDAYVGVTFASSDW